MFCISNNIKILGGPRIFSNLIILLQTSSTNAEFNADLESGLHFDLGGRTPEHKRFFVF